jgi:photosystem II stability/assembly factor-like uncharacterized protein|tara:strand:+ start:176 stop:3142 length:2967 start_codon:yes stop_codon:yes gene_type:complete
MRLLIFILLILQPNFNSIKASPNEDNDIFKNLKYRNVGPTRGGRVTTVHGVDAERNTFYMGTTGGGVWKTTDSGNNWFNISDGYFKSPSIGAINVYQKDPKIVYIGTGSDGIRSNIILGKGLYKSSDSGNSWDHIGLENSGQIGAVEIHPDDPNRVLVAAIGQPFKNNTERGLYETKDGGKTWDKILYISDSIGIVDVEYAPDDPNTIYAASWRVERKPWTIISGSENGGAYKSVDGGKNWNKIDLGIASRYIGKIDFAVSKSAPDRLFVMVEASDGKGGLYKSEDRGKTFKHMNNREELVNRPFYYLNVESNPLNSDILYSSANRFMISRDAGKSWRSYSTPHGDNHDIWINSNDTSVWVQSNDGGANITFNSGKTWSTQFNQPTAEIYQVEVDDQFPYWLYGGQQDNYSTVSVPSLPPYGLQAGPNAYITNTGGCETGPAVPKPGNPNIVYSNCKGRFGVYNKLTGQEKQYYVGASNMYGHNPKNLKYRFQRVSPIHVSPHNPNVIYHASQYLHKTTDEGVTWETISPDLTTFDPEKQVISGSPITRDITGEEFYSTIYSVRESKLKEGLIWIGANDGPVHVTRDGGKNWKDVTPDKKLNGGRVDSVEPSPHDEGKAFVTILRYQLGDWKPYIYKTVNYGEDWELITKGIPEDYPVRVIREDTEKEGILFAGTEFGMYISLDDGNNWQSFQQNLPITPITDIKIHRDDVVLATMGRSFWIMDNINYLRNLDNEDFGVLYPVANTIRYRYRPSKNNHVTYPQTTVDFDYKLNSSTVSDITISVYDLENNLINSYRSFEGNDEVDNYEMSSNEFTYISSSKISKKAGINRFNWDMRHRGSWSKNKKFSFINGPMVKPGKYKVNFNVDGNSYSQDFEILPDPRLSDISRDDYNEQEELLLKIRDFMTEVRMFDRMVESKLEKKKKNKILNLVSEELNTQEGTYMRPMLIDQIRYLQAMLSRADQRPGNDAYLRLNELRSQFKLLKEKLG